MKPALFVLLFLASIASANPIPVTGSGIAYNDYIDPNRHLFDAGGSRVQFAGTDGVNTVNVIFGQTFSGAGLLGDGETIFGFSTRLPDGSIDLRYNGFATINGVGTANFSFSVGGGGGFVTFLGAGNVPTISVDLISYLYTTTIAVPFEIQSTVEITPNPHTPEPSTWLLSALGISLIAIQSERGHKAKRATKQANTAS